MSPRRLGVTPAEASSGADLGCSSEYSIGCRVANTPLCVVEDWSGAGFRIKQPLNAGQPIVRQVVNHQTTKATRRMCVPRRRTLSTAAAASSPSTSGAGGREGGARAASHESGVGVVPHPRPDGRAATPAWSRVCVAAVRRDSRCGADSPANPVSLVVVENVIDGISLAVKVWTDYAVVVPWPRTLLPCVLREWMDGRTAQREREVRPATLRRW